MKVAYGQKAFLVKSSECNFENLSTNKVMFAIRSNTHAYHSVSVSGKISFLLQVNLAGWMEQLVDAFTLHRQIALVIETSTVK